MVFTLASTKRPSPKPPPQDWRAAGLPYYSYNFSLRKRFGGRVQRVSIDAGFTCPNVDGTVATGGCVFCDNRSFSPSRRLPRGQVTAQIDQAIGRLRHRYRCNMFLAYFQPGTNTYGPIDRLRPLLETALSHPKVVGLALGTRPDCVPPEVLDLVVDCARRTYVSLEYGMQSMHDRSLDWLNRGHHHEAMVDAVERSRGRGFDVCAHVILGIPGESSADMLATARELARLDVDAVKIHNLYAVRDTPLAAAVEAGRVRLLERETYVRLLVEFLERLSPRCVIERLAGDAPPEYLVGPAWCLEKTSVRTAVQAEFARRGTWQGRLWQ